jgi:type II secretory ATPase GspE/PulE/Tfp pilus assembly ATPase PilB-like protein
MVTFNEEKQEKKIEDLKKREAENLTQVLAQEYNLKYLDLTAISINTDALRIITLDEAKAANIAIFNIIDKKIHVGVLSPSAKPTIDAIKKLEEQGYILTIYLVSLESLKKVWDRYRDLSYSFETASGLLDISVEEINDFLSKAKSVEDVKKLTSEMLGSTNANKISKFLAIIITGALSLKASDIHIEPEEKTIRLRYRLDGVLIEIMDFDHEIFKLLLSRIKLLSGMKINVEGQAQDGRFSIKAGTDEIEIRASVLPGNYSDSVVFRILDPKTISIPLEELGVHPRLMKVFLEEIAKPNGMILTTGPTGSGKTTTLYAFLKKILTPELKIITIENPIEYHLEGIVQTQTNREKNYTFADGLRSILRQDPDVIMVGEIRDGETAGIAVNAALTGHLVFTTLHTNNAAGSFPRLIDLGVNPKIITSAVTLAMAQRLVRRLCNDCKKEFTIEGDEKVVVDKIVNSIKDKTYLEGLDTTKYWKASGCEKCNNLGYKGRICVYEAIKTDRKIEDAVEMNPSEREIVKASEDQNILNMAQDGIIKMFQGTTSYDELQRVVDLTLDN